VSARTEPVRTGSRLRPQGRGEGREGGEGRGRKGEGGNECVRADVLCPRERWIASARTRSRSCGLKCFLPPGNFLTDATVRPSHGRPSGHCPIFRPSIIIRDSA
jgi:hypothetical protein